MSSTTVKVPFIPYGRQWIEQDDLDAVAEVLKSPYLTTGPKVREFEEAFAKRVGASYAVSVSSGTAALHACAVAAGLKEGDEALVPTLSFLATANAIVYAGATPVFVDTEADGYNLDLIDAERKITPRTKAIFPVHFAGLPVDMDRVHDLAKRHHLIVIEDAAHALGADYKGKPIGALSPMTAFSFHPVKHITTGEGGMVTTNDADLARKIKTFRHHGIDLDVVAREQANTWAYDMSAYGFNYRLSDIQSALGISQLKKLNRFLARRIEIANLYAELFKSESGLHLPTIKSSSWTHAYHLYIIRLAESFPDGFRDALYSKLRADGIGTQVHYRPIHLHSFHQERSGKNAGCPVAEKLWKNILSLPMYPAMSDDDVRRVAQVLTKHLKQGK